VETIDLFLLGGTYRSVGADVVVELFGRSRDGAAVVARYYGFPPYFEIVDAPEEFRTRLKADPEVAGLEDLTLWVAGRDPTGHELVGRDRPVLRVTIHSPWKVPEYRERYRRPGVDPGLLACDIPFVHRFLYDKGLGLTVQFEAEPEPAEVAALYTIPKVVRIVTEGGREIRPAEPFRPPLTVLSFDIENAIRERTIFTLCGVVERPGQPRRSFRLHAEDERKILTDFAGVIEEEDPDVITGYNIGGYDLPLIEERARALAIPPLAFGRDRGELRDAGERLWRASGRVVADAWWAARRDLKPKQESLQFVARTLLGEGKLDVDRRNIEGEWAKDPERVMQYCEKDAELALRILQRLRTVEKAGDLATVAHLPLEEGMNGRTSLFIDAMLIPRADRLKVGVPPSNRARRESSIEGGYVHTIKPGIYRWVVVLDFKSMYPSIIIAKNICFTTISPDGTTVAPGGARFLSPEIRQGVIPQILRELLSDRDRFRRLSREATQPELRDYYDGLQNAVKVLMNSFYGVLASSFYRFTDKEIGAAITAFAREAITSIIRALDSEGYEVVYSDTDSVFVRSPEPSLEGARQFGDDLSKRFTVSGATFEFQSVYEALFSHGAKKRYVGRNVWPKEELVIRGYETRRTDAFDYQSEALLEVFELVLKGDTDRAIARSRELVQACGDGQVPVEKLVVARSVRSEEQYNEATRDALPFLRVFRQLKQEGYDVIPGMKVAWVVTDASKTPQEIEPWIEGRPFRRRPDYDYYADRVAQTLARVTEVFDWDAAALLKGHRTSQHRLGEVEPPAAGPPAALSDDAPATLSTPVGALGNGRARRRQTTL
jgi:DNA polymerase, archaea type